jgi:hypothetical protein
LIRQEEREREKNEQEPMEFKHALKTAKKCFSKASEFREKAAAPDQGCQMFF